VRYDAKAQALAGEAAEAQASGAIGEESVETEAAGGVTVGGADSTAGSDAGAPTMPAGTIASTLQAMFPHATIRTQENSQEAEVPEARPDSGSSAVADCEGCMVVLGDGEVGQMAAELEQMTKSQIDERALRALQNLSSTDACGVLRKVDDLVQAQGGRCRNLSSILQSVCRKLERRAAGRGEAAPAASSSAVTANAAAASDTSHPCGGDAGVPCSANSDGDGSGAERPDSAEEEGKSREAPEAHTRSRRSRARRKRRSRSAGSDADAHAVGQALAPVEPNVEPEPALEAEDAPSSAGEDGQESKEPAAGVATAGDSRLSRSTRGRKGRRGAPLSEQGEEGSSEATAEDVQKSSSSSASCDYWTTRRIERAAEKAFEFKRHGDQWDLKISMGSLDPPLSEAGMERYCRWLRARLASIREEHGAQALRRCCGDVDFSSNGLSNQAVWMLLETLTKNEVHAASLKLYKNKISQGGVLAICEFIRTNKRAQAVYEMHLSHNEIDDDSAHELLRTLRKQRSRYPPRRTAEGRAGSSDGRSSTLVPVWVRLNHNRILDPAGTLRALEAEGITYCTARNSHGCGPGKCSKADCPLAHLYLFADQATRCREKERAPCSVDNNASGRTFGARPSPGAGAAATDNGVPAAGGRGDDGPSKTSKAVDAGSAIATAAAPDAKSGAGVAETATGARRKRGRKSRHRDQAPDSSAAAPPLVPPPPPPGPPPPIQHQ